MLRIGKLTDYAMLILSTMAKEPQAIMSATAMAVALSLPFPTVSKVLKMLCEAQLVNSIRGAEGGYRLNRTAKEISVADVIIAMEGGLAMTECCEGMNRCVIEARCAMKENWKKINKMVYTLLGKVSILDMLSPLAIRG